MHLAETNPKFVEAIKTVENNITIAKRRGEYKDVQGVWKWFPGKSPEGGLPTLAWGHKLTQKEWTDKRVYFIDPVLKQEVYKDFRYGLVDAEVEAILKMDLNEAEDLASVDWDKYIGFENKMPWSTLPDKYKGVLINLVFNSGPLVKKGKWVWTTIVRGIKANDDTLVAQGMVTSYKRPDGVRVRLTSRAKEIAKCLGLPYQILK